jgi:hypothetical protein
MGRSRRCRSIVMSTSVVALGATGACPAANAASNGTPGSHGNRAVVAHKRAAPVPARRRVYVYKAVIGDTEAMENEPNMACAGAGARLTGIAFAELNGPGSSRIWAQHPAAFNKTYTLTTSPATTITVSWTPPAERREAQEESAAHNGEIRNPRLQGRDNTTTVGAVCAATHSGANIAEIAGAGARWELPAPVTSLAALVSHTPTSIAPNEYRVAFEVQPDGAVPPFTQEVESPTREMERAKAKQVEAG